MRGGVGCGKGRNDTLSVVGAVWVVARSLLQGVFPTNNSLSQLVFALFAALAEFERELIRERTRAGLASARARGRKGGRPHALSKAQVRLAQAAMEQRVTKVSQLCLELGVTKATIYRYVAPDGSLRNRGRQVLAR